MSQTKIKTLYPHPFSKAYWKDAAGELKDTRVLVFAALMIALRVAMKLVAIPLAPGLKINTAFIVNALGAMVFGPVVAAICAVATDILGYLQNPEGVYFVPFVLTEVAGSVIFALFLYRAKVGPVRVMLSRFTICIVVNMLIQTPIYMWYYALYMGGKQYTFAMALPSIIKNLFMFPIESVVLTLFLRIMIPITNRMGLTQTGVDAKDGIPLVPMLIGMFGIGAIIGTISDMKFTKKQVAALAILFAVGCGCVFGYLNYYYSTTNLITKSQGDDRYNANTAVAQAVAEHTDGLEGETVITIVTKSNKKFLSSEMHYTAICYTVNEEALEGYDIDGCTDNAQKIEAIRAMSKTPAGKAAAAGALTEIGTVTATINDKTGDVLSVELK